jgi:hypothetical protein
MKCHTVPRWQEGRLASAPPHGPSSSLAGCSLDQLPLWFYKYNRGGGRMHQHQVSPVGANNNQG